MIQDPLNFEHAARLLKSGGVLLMGTDTLPGFHCRADQSGAVERILGLKGRQAGKSLLVLAGSARQAEMITGHLDPDVAEYCQKCWPGPFSLILPSAKNLPSGVSSESGTVAVRVPAVPSLRALLMEVGFPLVSTSANLSGMPAHTDLAEAWREFKDNVDGFWQPDKTKEDNDDAAGPAPSALIDLSVWPPKVLRPGPLDPPPVG